MEIEQFLEIMDIMIIIEIKETTKIMGIKDLLEITNPEIMEIIWKSLPRKLWTV